MATSPNFSESNQFITDHVLRRRLFRLIGDVLPIKLPFHSVEYFPLLALEKPMPPEETQNVIAEVVKGGDSFLLGRFGSTELGVLVKREMLHRRGFSEKLLALAVTGELPFFSVAGNRSIQFDSGFYPLTQQSLNRFCDLLEATMGEIDLLASWVPGENVFAHRLAHSAVTSITHIEPFFVRNPWTVSLEHKTVLVVHPFAETIEEQFRRKRTYLFQNNDLLPEFELLTVKPPQTLWGPDPRFNT